MRRLLLGLAGTLIAGMLSLTPSAAYAETTLCVGKTFKETLACDSGWAVNMMFMHWRMYRGHNCTNYVAYRLGRDGVQEPNYLLGSARSWAGRAKSHGVPVDSSPEAGAAGTWPGRNHVVYVEQVGPGWLEITEDSWTSKRYRRYIAYKGERNYPSQFIHFRGKNAIIGGTPTIAGTPLVGQVLMANPGTWGPSGVKLAYQWLRDGVVVGGATGRSYRLTKLDAGHRISISITGTYPGKLARTASSESTNLVSAGTVTPGTPRIDGLPVIGATLVAAPGIWRPADLKLTYAWYASGRLISGATSQTYKISQKLRGKTLTVRVTGSGPGYAPVTAESSPTGKVVKPGEVVGPVTAGTPTITESKTMMVGDKLSSDPGEWGPAPVKLGVKWLRDGVAIPGATTWTYTLTTADVGKRLRIAVTGTRKQYSAATAQSAETSPVFERRIRPLVQPRVSGNPIVGGTLTADTGQWIPSGTRSSVVWLRDGSPIAGAKSRTYVVTANDLRHTLGIRVTTLFPKLAPDVRRMALAQQVRATPKFSVKAVPSSLKHSKRLMISVSAVGKQLGGAVRISEGGVRRNTIQLSRFSATPYEFQTNPGDHVVTFTYVGPAWLVPASHVVPIKIK